MGAITLMALAFLLGVACSALFIYLFWGSLIVKEYYKIKRLSKKTDKEIRLVSKK